MFSVFLRKIKEHKMYLFEIGIERHRLIRGKFRYWLKPSPRYLMFVGRWNDPKLERKLHLDIYSLYADEMIRDLREAFISISTVYRQKKWSATWEKLSPRCWLKQPGWTKTRANWLLLRYCTSVESRSESMLKLLGYCAKEGDKATWQSILGNGNLLPSLGLKVSIMAGETTV